MWSLTSKLVYWDTSAKRKLWCNEVLSWELNLILYPRLQRNLPGTVTNSACLISHFSGLIYKIPAIKFQNSIYCSLLKSKSFELHLEKNKRGVEAGKYETIVAWKDLMKLHKKFENILNVCVLIKTTWKHMLAEAALKGNCWTTKHTPARNSRNCR